MNRKRLSLISGITFACAALAASSRIFNHVNPWLGIMTFAIALFYIIYKLTKF